MAKSLTEESKTQNDDSNVANTLSILISEFLFTVLPLIVLAVVLIYQRKSFGLFHTPEWSFVSAILFGQILVKLIAATLSEEGGIHWQRVVLAASALIVLGIVPSLLILTLVLVSDTPSNGLAIAQLLLCVISITLFFVFGGAMQHMITEHEGKKGRT